MPQSLAKLYVHLIFSTKNRAPLITPAIRLELNPYLGGILHNQDCQVVKINSVGDHVHALFMLSKKHALCDVIEEVKKGSSKWTKTKGPEFGDFYWQSGYGAFSVSQSAIVAVTLYIENQEEHHKKISFQDEYRAFLRKYQIEFDERYVWD